MNYLIHVLNLYILNVPILSLLRVKFIILHLSNFHAVLLCDPFELHASPNLISTTNAVISHVITDTDRSRCINYVRRRKKYSMKHGISESIDYFNHQSAEIFNHRSSPRN